MSFKRFVRLNLLLVPALCIAGYLFLEYLPIIFLPVGVAYITFAVLIMLVWGLSQLSLARDSS